MVGLASLANPLVDLFLTEKWNGTVALLQILCFDWMFDHLSGINLNLLYVKGRSDLALRLEIIKKNNSDNHSISLYSFGNYWYVFGKSFIFFDCYLCQYILYQFPNRTKFQNSIKRYHPIFNIVFSHGRSCICYYIFRTLKYNSIDNRYYNRHIILYFDFIYIQNNLFKSFTATNT